ncbi:MAG: hypothetical protein ABIR16_03015, partial [Dokdonella sp.]
MLTLTRLLALLVLAAAAIPCGAQTAGGSLPDPLAPVARIAYGVAFTDLYRVDLDSRIATYVGFSGQSNGQLIGQIRGLNLLPNGDLVGLSGNLRALIRINKTTGAATVTGVLNLDGTGQFGTTLDLSMAYGCDGKYWLMSAVTGQLWKVDPATAQITLIGSTGHKLTGIVAYGDTLYGAGGQGDTGFYRIDMTTAAAAQIGSYGPALPWVNVVAMSFDEAGTLYASLSYNPGPAGGTVLTDWSDLATINTSTGVVTNLGNITGPSNLRRQSMNGFVIAPTQCPVAPPPEPAGDANVPVPATTPIG